MTIAELTCNTGILLEDENISSIEFNRYDNHCPVVRFEIRIITGKNNVTFYGRGYTYKEAMGELLMAYKRGISNG